MHDYGVSSFTEFTPPSGTKQTLRDDAVWDPDFALNPVLTTYSPQSPQVIPAGSVIHTHCKWHNTTGGDVKFPAEMCVFFAFMLNEVDVSCANGKWLVTGSAAANSPASASNANAGAGAGAGAIGSAASAIAGMGGPTAGAGAPLAGASAGSTAPYSSAADEAITSSASFDQGAVDCTTPCAFDPDISGCTLPCFQSQLHLSASCAKCEADAVDCSAKKCRSACIIDRTTPECRSCVSTMCGAETSRCDVN
jgi:hypothetical protein